MHKDIHMDLELCAVIVPVYKKFMSKSEFYSFQRTVRLLDNKTVYIVAPVSLKNQLSRFKYDNVQFAYFENKYFSSISSYNRMLTSLFFYQYFSSFKYILIVQLDALVIQNSLDQWCKLGFSYIGSPWFEGFDFPRKPLRFFGIGNGGFSLRKVSDFIRVLDKIRYVPNYLYEKSEFRTINFLKYIKNNLLFAYNKYPFIPLINEDFFWSCLVPQRCSFFNIPSVDEAIGFAFEAEPRFLYEMSGNVLPFGCHAWEKFDRDFWIDKLNM